MDETSMDPISRQRHSSDRRRQRAHTLPAIIVCVSLGACSAGDGKGLNVSGRPLDESGDVPLAATLESIQANVFDPSCIVCHAGAAAPQGLRLDKASSYASLVGVTSREDGSLLRVAPGNPGGSYLVRKLEGTASAGERMPLGAPPIPQATIDFVRQWILDGAPPASGAAPGSAPVVVSLIPAPDSVNTDFPMQISAGFDQDIDASTINTQTFTLVRSGDGQFDNGDDVTIAAVSVALSPVNARLAVMDLAGVAAVEDRYRVVLEGSGPNLILSVDGTALDGEFTGSLPSGDGAEGGDFVAEFEVQGIQPSLASLQNNLFSPTCAAAGCHTGPTGPILPGGMDLSSEDASFASLVGVASIESPATLRVAPGDADGSYIIHKLEGTAAVGNRMPFGGPFLDQATIDVVRAWIDAGAQR
jgi:Bacterial Ig-like domain